MLVGGFRKVLLATTALVPLSAAAVDANPLDPSVVAGSATVQGLGTSNVTVTQSSNSAIIDWNTFNIGSGERTAIVQPGASSVQLDRVTGGLGPSQILGSLSSNGKVFLVNPDGILFGQDAQVNVGGLLATTNDISNGDFMAGRYNFTIPGRPDASVVNQGTITAQTDGFAALVAPGVRNTGTITATLGKVGLASANGFSLDLYGDQLITLQVGDQIAATVKDVATGQPLSSLVSNEGKIKANGGRVELTAAAARTVVDSVINNKGVIEANSIGTHNGMIVLGAATGAHKPVGSPKQLVKVSGKLSAAGKGKNETGGKIQITGESVQLANAMLDASGRAGGGTVLVGGDTGGGTLSSAEKAIPAAALEGTSIPTASQVSVDAASTINVSAIDSGNGGKAILWSDAATQFAGTILASGGAQFGNGGFVETSSHGNLGFSGNVDIGAPNGLVGTLLLDPKDVTIGTTGAWIVTPSAIQTALASGKVIVSTAASGTDAGDITVAQDVSWSSGNSLTLSAYRNIAVDANITNTGGAAVNLRADSSGTGVGTVTFGSGAQISTSGVVSIYYDPSVNPAGSVVNGTSYVNPAENFTGHVTGGAQLTAYMLVNSVYDLQNMQNNLGGNYALGKNIDASATAGWNGGLGFNPIGWSSDNCASAGCFVGIFDGLGNAISGFTSNGYGVRVAGLFGYVGTGSVIRNIGVSGNVGGNNGGNSAAALLAVFDNGSIINSFTNGTVTGGGYIGGLVASLGPSGTITNSYSNATVTGGSQVIAAGGLVGSSGGTVNGSYANGNVTGGVAGSATGVGGLVGVNGGTVANSYANGTVIGSVAGGVGGLVGLNSGGTISGSYANDGVSGNANVGGLVGQNTYLGTVSGSYATGNVTGGWAVGGLVGVNSWYSISDPSLTSTINNSYATGAVSGTGGVGGLVGQNFAMVSASYATGNVSGSGDDIGGLVGFNVGANSYYAYSGTVNNSYATGSVSGVNNVGGLVGFNGSIASLFSTRTGIVTNSYAVGHVSGSTNIGGLVGNNQGIWWSDGTIANSYWDTTLSGQSVGVGLGSGAGAIGLPTSQLKAALPSGFGSAVWGITANVSYPYLLWEAVTKPPSNPPTPNPPITLTGQSGVSNPPPLSPSSVALTDGIYPFWQKNADSNSLIDSPVAGSTRSTIFLPTNFISQSQASEVIPYALLARDVGSGAGSDAILAFRQTGISWVKFLKHFGVNRHDIFEFIDSGFYARVYINQTTKEVVIAYRESISLLDHSNNGRIRDDWAETNVLEALGGTTPQYKAAHALADAVKAYYGHSVTLVGFSKGGGQASYAASENDKVVTFDAARNEDSVGGKSVNQINVDVPGDIVGDPRSVFQQEGALPGETVYVYSGSMINDRAQRSLNPSVTHSIDGIIQGLTGAGKTLGY